MFDHLTNQQGIADQLKAWVLQGPVRNRRQALELVNEFEGAVWQPQLLDAAAVGLVKVDAGGQLMVSAKNTEPALVAELLLRRYFDLIPPRLYGTIDAAEYLGLSEAAMKHHMHISGELTGIKVGNSIVFTKGILDAFNAKKRKPGRPKKEKSSAQVSEL